MVDQEQGPCQNVETQVFSASDLQNLAQLMNQLATLQGQIVQSAKPSTNLMQDRASPYYLHSSENPGISLTPNPLTTLNYHSWSRSVWISLKTKNKLSFIDGSLPKSEKSDCTFEAWDRCNTFVLSWLHASLSSEILQSVMWCNVASELWKDLKHRFYEGDLFRIVELEEEMYSARQGDLSITSFFTKMKGLWEELEEFQPIPSCNCTGSCTCGLEIVRGYRKQSQVVRFLEA
ncbi:uncharacterized protein [Arachis hypogaea]|uniref:uncharacterized protein n=1 Tax=Arachis hypogaea TaxID=3818 RepID=UPI003B218046